MTRARTRQIRIQVRSAAIGLGGLVGLGLIATLVAQSVIREFATTHCVPKLERDLRWIDGALEDYVLAHGGRFPDSLQILVTPDVNGDTYLDMTRVPKDPWGREYFYEPPRPDQPLPIVRSYGRDGQPGGEGDDADIDNISIRREASGSNTQR